METETLVARVHQTAEMIGLALDSDFSSVRRSDDGTLEVVASVDAFPTSQEERSFSQSALHAALLDDLSDLEQNVNVRVFLPPVATKQTTTSAASVPELATQKINAWSTGVHDLAVKAVVQFAKSSYQCAVDTYPWIEKEAMRAAIPAAVQVTLHNMNAGTADPLLASNNADLILPPLASVIRPDEICTVNEDVVRILGGDPSTILQFYEVIYLSVTNRLPVSDTTRDVFSRIFRVA